MSYVQIISPLVLHADPVIPNHAVTKRYVDAKKTSANASWFTSGVLPIGRLPALTGDIASAEGSGITELTVNGVTAGSYPKVTIDSAGRVNAASNLLPTDVPNVPWGKVTTGKPTTAAGYGITNLIALSGGTVSGPITSSASATANLDAVTKGYVDSALTGTVSGTLAVGDIVRKPVATAPTGFLRCNGGYADRTTYTDLFGVMGPSLYHYVSLDYTSYTAVGGGQPWNQQYDFNTTQSSDITSWAKSLPSDGSVMYASFAATKNRIYRLGGRVNDSPMNICAVANASDDGSLSMWSVSSNLTLTRARELSTCFVVKNRIYMVGGNNYIPMDSVDSAAINSDGTIGTWSLNTGSIPIAVFGSCSFVTKNRVYIIGGFNNSSGYSSAVQTATINSDGTLGVWVTGTSLPTSAAHCTAIVVKNNVYVLGGLFGGTATSNVYTAPINNDGTIGSWSILSNVLPFDISASQIVTTRNKIYALIANTQNVIACPIDTNGSLGTWYSLPDSPMVTVIGSGIVAVKNKLHIIGNSTGGHNNSVYSASFSGGLNDYSKFYDGSINKFDGSNITGTIAIEDTGETANYQMPGSGQPWHQQYGINSLQSAETLNSWTTSTPLPATDSYSQAVVTKNKVYVLSGFNNAIYKSVINSDGSLGAWSSTVPTFGRYQYSQALVTKNRLYLIGGVVTGVPTSNVIYTTIDANGDIGATWQSAGFLPYATSNSQVILTRNRVYLLGGHRESTGASSAILTATVNTDGSLAEWSVYGQLPRNIQDGQVVVTKNRVYVMGGHNGIDAVRTSHYASVNADGTLGSWISTGDLPLALTNFQTVTTKSRLYVLGGINAGSNIAAVFSCPINIDGSLGAWVANGGILPTPVKDHQVIVTMGKLHILGGGVATVQTTNISGGLNDYSPYYDGTILPVDPATNFQLPDYTSSEKGGVNFYIKY